MFGVSDQTRGADDLSLTKLVSREGKGNSHCQEHPARGVGQVFGFEREWFEKDGFDDLITRQENENGGDQGDKVFGSSFGYFYSDEDRYGGDHIGRGMNRIRNKGH